MLPPRSLVAVVVGKSKFFSVLCSSTKSCHEDDFSLRLLLFIIRSLHSARSRAIATIFPVLLRQFSRNLRDGERGFRVSQEPRSRDFLMGMTSPTPPLRPTFLLRNCKVLQYYYYYIQRTVHTTTRGKWGPYARAWGREELSGRAGPPRVRWQTHACSICNAGKWVLLLNGHELSSCLVSHSLSLLGNAVIELTLFITAVAI